MGDMAISRDELQTLLAITNNLAVDAGGDPCILNRVAAQIGTLMPFERLLLLHERARERGSVTLVYEYTDTCEPGTALQPRCVEDLSISRHLERLPKQETLQNVFHWRSSTAEGIAGAVNSVDQKSGRLGTLLQLEQLAGRFVSKHLFFVNMIIPYLHVHLTHRPAGLASTGTRQSLTRKEREVLHWIVEGKTAWEVGRILSMSERTVKFHLGNIYSKLDVANRAQAVTKANRLRLI
jgi:LuxR family quorum-sensing system transcriptional regulator SolR